MPITGRLETSSCGITDKSFIGEIALMRPLLDG
jgi:hypothetical protein